MEPQIVDYYNEYPHSINVIDKMNEELSDLQKENNKLKDDLCMNPEYGRPTVEYKNEEELEKVKSKLYEELKDEIYKSKGQIEERTVKNVLYKLIPNHYEVNISSRGRFTGGNWVHWKGCEILKYVNYSKKSLIKYNVEFEKTYDIIYDIITNEIDELMKNGDIVKYKCNMCGKLVSVLITSPIGDNQCVNCMIDYNYH